MNLNSLLDQAKIAASMASEEILKVYQSDDFEPFESEDTMSILNRYIEEAEIDLDKSRVQKIMQDIYQEACELV